MPGTIYLTTAYLPPIEYFTRISEADEVYIEREENYLKQSYRNRCYILSAGGVLPLTIPVFLGSIHKTHIKDIRIDYSRRWQQVHLRALAASYRSSPWFLYYYEIIEKIILSGYEYLLDLNTELLSTLLVKLKMEREIAYTTEFMPVEGREADFRYIIHPKKHSRYRSKEYFQVFSYIHGFVPGLSVADLLFNMGPDSKNYL